MLLDFFSTLVGQAFTQQDLPDTLGRVIIADRPDLADVQCNGALQAAKLAGKKPREVAEAVVKSLQGAPETAFYFSDISIAGPGFINFKVSDKYLSLALQGQSDQEKFGVKEKKKEKIVIDFCGMNIAKAIHVGHMRPTIIGDALQRMFRFAGHDVTSDVHLGDWGLPMGIVINEVQREQPDLPYFKEGAQGPFPKEAPFTLRDLARLYPQGSARTKDDEEERQKVRLITAKLQEGHPGYTALWKHIVDVSLIDIRGITDELNVYPTLWYGESDAHPYIAPMIEDLKKRNIAVMDDGALIVRVLEETDTAEVPPVILVKRDGGVNYATTDLATIIQRQKDFTPDRIIYVVDQRQDLHFKQVFRAARLANYAPQAELFFVGFGTMNGKDGKPFKTRDGGVPTLREFIDMLVDKAAERVRALEKERLSDEDFKTVTTQVGHAAMKFGDLMNNPRSDYIFDVDKFVSFEGKTGPYLQYTAVRINALLQKALQQNLKPGEFSVDSDHRETALLLLQFPDAFAVALNDYAPNVLADYLFRVAQSINRFYQNIHILTETDTAKQGAALALLGLGARILTQGLDLLGINVPKQM